MNNLQQFNSTTPPSHQMDKRDVYQIICSFHFKNPPGAYCFIVLPCSLPWRQLRISCAPPRIFSVRKGLSVALLCWSIGVGAVTVGHSETSKVVTQAGTQLYIYPSNRLTSMFFSQMESDCKSSILSMHGELHLAQP